MIAFNRSPVVTNSLKYIEDALLQKTSGDGGYTRKCAGWIESACDSPNVLLTTSGSHALDMAAKLCNLEPGDEVIMSSYTFSSTANAFVGCGAKIVFVDICPDTMNIDETLIEDAVTDRTRVIVPMHYAGVACKMDHIISIAQKHNILVVEDAAHAIMSEYNNKPLGSFGDFGCLSFHETKNFSMGEGGALLIQDQNLVLNAEIIREKGTNRSCFFRGEIDKYSWVDWGSSYLPSEINAAYLWSQLEMAEDINNRRMQIWSMYYNSLSPLAEKGMIKLPVIPDNCIHNAHMFYIKTNDYHEQERLINFLRTGGVYAVFHYVPLHSSKAGQSYGRFYGNDIYTTLESQRLVRLPLWYGLTDDEVNATIETVNKYYL